MRRGPADPDGARRACPEPLPYADLICPRDGRLTRMDWSAWLTLSPDAFARRLRRRLAKPLGRNDVIALYNAPIVRAPEEHDRVAAIGQATAELLRKQRRCREALDMAELSARAHFIGRDAAAGFAGLKEMIQLDADAARPAAIELARLLVEDVVRSGP